MAHGSGWRRKPWAFLSRFVLLIGVFRKSGWDKCGVYSWPSKDGRSLGEKRGTAKDSEGRGGLQVVFWGMDKGICPFVLTLLYLGSFLLRFYCWAARGREGARRNTRDGKGLCIQVAFCFDKIPGIYHFRLVCFLSFPFLCRGVPANSSSSKFRDNNGKRHHGKEAETSKKNMTVERMNKDGRNENPCFPLPLPSTPIPRWMPLNSPWTPFDFLGAWLSIVFPRRHV